MNELILPKTTTQLSSLVAGELKRFDALLHPNFQVNPALRQQFWASVIVEVNGLKPNTQPASVMIAIANLCQVGLMFGKSLGHAYLVPFKGQAQLIFGYRGFLELAYGNSFLSNVTTELVLRDEPCELWVDETGRRIKHSIPLNRPEPCHGNTVGAYCVFTTKSGARDVVMVQEWELRQLYQNATRRDGSVWASNYQGMALKTPIRRAAKLWRQTRELSLAVGLDEAADRDESQVAPHEFDSPSIDPADGERRSLEALLRGKVGCKSEADMDAVCEWTVVALPFAGVAEAGACGEVIDEIEKFAREYDYESVLSTARDIKNGYPTR